MAIKKPTEEEFIDDLIQPISDIYQETNSKVLSIMVNRIKQIGTLSATDAGRLSILLKNQDLKQIEKVLSDATNLSIKQIDSIVEESATYNDDLSEKLYKAKNMPPTTFATDSALLSVVDVAKKNMVDSVVNLSKTTGFMINGKMTSVAKTYNYAINRSVFEVQQGLFDFNTAMRSTIKELADSGIRTVDFESGYSRRLDSQVRMNISDGIRQLNANYREQQGNQFGSDGIELSAHVISSPEHAPFQGKQYSNKEFENIQSALERPFFVMNCKHSSFPIILGVSDPVYSDSELAEIRQNSDELVKYSLPSGKTVSRPRYEATQDQRLQELKLRKLKDMKNQLETLGDDVGVKEYSKRIKEETAKYKKMSEQMGISPKMERTRVVKQKTNTNKTSNIKESDFIAKDIKEAKEYAKNVLGFNEIDYGETKLEVVNVINKTIKNIQNKYPEIQKIDRIIPGSKNSKAVLSMENASLNAKGILKGNSLDLESVQNKTIKELEDAHNESVLSGWHPQNTTFESVIWHEYAHAYGSKLEADAFLSKYPDMPNDTTLFTKYLKQSLSNVYYKDVINMAKADLKKQGFKFETSNISRYSLKSVSETFAEAFSEYNTSSNPSKESIAIMKAAGII